MGKEQLSPYYDAIYTSSKSYQDGYRVSHYLPTWALVMQLLDKHAPVKEPRLLDIGCGTGQFAEFLVNHKTVNYTGLDFSKKAIELAKSRKYHNGFNRNIPIFIKTDINEQFVWDEKFDAYTIMETLEHIENDTEIVSRIPQGAFVIITVPTFDDEGHVRFFTTKEEVLKRYGPFLGCEISNNRKVVEMVRSWFVIYGYRNSTPMPLKVNL